MQIRLDSYLKISASIMLIECDEFTHYQWYVWLTPLQWSGMFLCSKDVIGHCSLNDDLICKNRLWCSTFSTTTAGMCFCMVLRWGDKRPAPHLSSPHAIIWRVCTTRCIKFENGAVFQYCHCTLAQNHSCKYLPTLMAGALFECFCVCYPIHSCAAVFVLFSFLLLLP